MKAFAVTTPPLRVAGIAIDPILFETTASAYHELCRALDLCAIPAEQRAQVRFCSDTILAAVGIIDVKSASQPANTSIVKTLTTTYPALVRSMQVLKIAWNNYDESDALGALAALATHLQELTFCNCGLSSLWPLEGRSEYLRKVNLAGCNNLSSLEGLGHHACLEDIDVSYTYITSIEPLRTCAALTKVDLEGCEELSSIDALEVHHWLREVNVSETAITSIEPLRTCPALMKVDLEGCQHLSSIDGIEGHQWLQEVNASYTFITSIEPLRSCPALRKVALIACQQLASLEGLEGHLWLTEVNALSTAICSVEPLRTCPFLKEVCVSGCMQLSSIEPLDDHAMLQVHAQNTMH